MVDLMCDFCAEQGPWTRQVHGDWLTCPRCGQLMDLHRWADLIDQAVLGAFKRHKGLVDTPRHRRVLREKLRVSLSALIGEDVGARVAT